MAFAALLERNVRRIAITGIQVWNSAVKPRQRFARVTTVAQLRAEFEGNH